MACTSTIIDPPNDALDAGGGILVASADGAHLLLVRFDAAGTLDTSFGTSGVGKASFTGSAEARSMAVQADGAILVSGSIGSTTVGLARFLSTGALDTTFGSGGTQTASISGVVQAMRLQSDGKIIVAGYTNNDFDVARFTIAGALDASFDGDGMLTANLTGVDEVYALAIGPDYKITAAGSAGSDIGLARFKVSSSLEERLYVLTDANHNVTGVTDVFGIVKERFVYDPYGAATVLTAAYGAASDSLSWVYRDQGLRYDAVTNTQDNRNRIYFISLGRFGQNDIGYPDGANRYERERSNPVAFVDPSGRNAIGKVIIGGAAKVPGPIGWTAQGAQWLIAGAEANLAMVEAQAALARRQQAKPLPGMPWSQARYDAAQLPVWAGPGDTSQVFGSADVSSADGSDFAGGAANSSGDASGEGSAGPADGKAGNDAAAEPSKPGGLKNPDGSPKTPGEQSQELRNAQAQAAKNRPSIEDEGSEWEGAKKRPKQRCIENTRKSDDRDDPNRNR